MFVSSVHAVADISHREQVIFPGSPEYAASDTEMPDKLQAIAAATRVFEAMGLSYALIGGLAVGIRSGIPRATLDVDFAIPTTADRVRLLAAMAASGFRLTGEFAHSINFEHTSGEPVQLAFDPAFDDFIARAEKMKLGEFEIPVVTKEDLIDMKRRAASDPARRRSKSLRDQADIALLEGDVPEPHEGW